MPKKSIQLKMLRRSKPKEFRALIVKAYAKHEFNVSKAMQEIGVDRCQFYNWQKNDPELTQALREAEMHSASSGALRAAARRASKSQ